MATETNMMELVVPDLCCVECSQGVEIALRRAPGVRALQVLGMSEKVRITYDETTQPEQVVQAVEKAGHTVTSWRPEGQASRVEVAAPASPRESRRVQTFALLRLLFVGFVSLIALVEIAGESLGLLRGVEELIPWPVALAVVVIGGYPIFRGAFLGLRQHRINTDAVMSVGILAAAAIHEFIGAALIVFFVMVAHYLEEKTTGRARRAIAELAALQPTTARVKRETGEEEVLVTALSIGNVVVVRAGEQVPIDGMVMTGEASVNQAPITGESLPIEKHIGDEVFAGTISERGYLEVRVERVGDATTLGRILHLVEEAESQKSPVQRFADRFSATFLPLVITLAVLTFVLSRNLTAAIAVLVAACPCAVGLATPLSVVAAVGAGARRGLLIKGGLSLEMLAKVDTLVVDKTGTLTYGRPQVTDIVPQAGTHQDEILAMAAALEHSASHPLASALLSAAETRGLALPVMREVEVLPSRGVMGREREHRLILGARRLLGEQDISLSHEQEVCVTSLEQQGKTVLVLARDGLVMGLIAVADTMRAEARDALAQVRRLGIRRILLLTGDNERVAEAVAREAGISEIAANLLPEDKIATVKRLQAEGHRVLMVGDGINDAPALTQANVGIAMGGIGTAVAQEAAEVALLRDDLLAIPEAIRLGRRTYGIIRQNIFFGIGFTVLVMGLASFGLIGPILAAASQSVPDVGVALNASRLLGGRHKRA
ncbi:MAG: heavy metal translocating P-type ATPase [Chloroflexota bacterium]